MRRTIRVPAAIAVAVACLGVALVRGQAAPDPFAFREGRSVVTAITLAAGADGTVEVEWPESAGEDWDTALLRVDMRADDVGPSFLAIASNDKSERQYFRPGESGTRWVNLTFLRGDLRRGSRVTLQPQGMSVDAGESSLRLFSSRPDLTKKILVLAPHPDDAEIGAFGLYAFRQATVVTITAGNAGSPTYEAVFGPNDIPAQYQFKGRARVIDSITVPWQGGIPPERCYNLGYFDARLLEMYRRQDEIIPEMYGPNTDIGLYRRDNIGSLLPKGKRDSTWKNLVADVESLLKKVNPAIVAAPHPQLDNHRDHQITTVALVEALRRWNKRVTFLLYTNHADNNRYPYGPAGTLASLPAANAREIQVDRVFSLPLSIELQRAKLFALESMHDLRYSPTRQYQLAIGPDRALEPEKEGPRPDTTYLRRGPRSNEIFYVFDQDSVKPMIEAFIGTLPPATPAR